MTRRVGIFIFDEVEVLDMAGPFEVFSVASRVKAKLEPDLAPPFETFTIGETTEPIHARGGLAIVPRFSFSDHPKIDVIVIPGGIVSGELRKESVIRWIDQVARQAQIVTSVCTGASLLAQTGLLDGKRATTHWDDISDLKAAFPNLSVEDNVRWVEQGNILTSAGISAGIDMSLHLVSKLETQELAAATARQMDYRWLQKPDYDDQMGLGSAAE